MKKRTIAMFLSVALCLSARGRSCPRSGLMRGELIAACHSWAAAAADHQIGLDFQFLLFAQKQSIFRS